MGELSPSDVVALSGNGNNGDGWGGNGNGWWIILLFMIFGWGGNRGNWGNQGGGGGGYVGGDVLYPWLNQSNQINDGFRDQMMNGTLNNIQQSVTAGFANAATQLCQCCGDMQMFMCNGFNGVNTNMLQGFNNIEQGANQRQMANMQQMFGMQMANMQGFTGLQYQTADQTATILAEHCADRAALSDGVRDIIAAQNNGTQRILDQLCQDKIDAKNEEIANLRQQLNMQNLAASQIQQTAQILQGQNAEVDALYNRLATCPVGTMPVYGNQPIFTCPNNQYNNYGCGCGMAA